MRSQDFISSFHNLGGITLGEKRKRFHILLNHFKAVDQHTINAIVSSVTPTTYLESVFRIEIFLFFKRTNELFEALKTEPEENTKKIFKNKWFFQEPFNALSAGSLVEELLPSLSVVIRLRVIRCLARYNKNEHKLDLVFDQLLSRYGFHTALQMLAGCSAKKLEQIFDKFKVKLTSKQLKIIHRKNRDVVTKYIEKNDCFNLDYIALFKYIPSKEPELFYKYSSKWKGVYRNLGRRSTRKLINYNKIHVMNNPADYIDLFHPRMIHKSFSREEFRLVLKNMFPKNINGFRVYPLQCLLRFLPAESYYNTYSQIYKEVYGKSLFDCVSHMDEDFIELVSDTSEREKWIIAKVKEGVSDTKYLHCYEINKAIDIIKRKINLTSTFKIRTIYAEKLVDTCKFYNDHMALLGVLDYFCKRHRNDPILNDFVSHLYYTFRLSKLDAEHWKYIFELLEIIKVKNLFIGCRLSILLQHVEYLWNNKMPIEDEVLKLVLDGLLDAGSSYSISDFHDVELKRRIIILLLDFVPQKVTDVDKLHKQDIQFISWILEWNIKHPAKSIDVAEYPRLLLSLKCVIEKDMNEKKFSEMMDYVEKILKIGKTNDDIEKYLTDIYFSFIHHTKKIHIETRNRRRFRYRTTEEFPEKMVRLLIKNYPQDISKYADSLVVALYENLRFNKNVLYHIRVSDNDIFKEKVIQFGKTNYERAEVDVDHILKILTFLMNPPDYIETVSKYVPSDEKMDIDEENYSSRVAVQQSVANSFKYTMCKGVIPTVLEFCRGDCLSCGLNSLYYQFLHFPENYLKIIVKDLLTKPAVLKKHAYYLSCQFSSTEEVVELFQFFINEETETVLKKDILMRLFQYFKKNLSERVLESILVNIPRVTKSDKKLINLLNKLFEPCIDFKVKYFLLLMKEIKEIREGENAILLLSENFLNELNKECMQQLPSEVLEAFVIEYFLTANACFPKAQINSFVVSYIFSCGGDISHKFNIIFTKIDNLRNKTANTLKERMKYKQQINETVKLFCNELKSQSIDLKLLHLFYEGLLKVMPIEEYFDVLCQLRVMILYKQSSNIKDFSVKFYSLLKEVKSKYDPPVVNILLRNLPYAFKNDDDENCNDKLFSLCRLLYEIDDSVYNCFFILELLPTDLPENEENRKKFLEFVEHLGHKKEPLVQINYNLFVRSLRI